MFWKEARHQRNRECKNLKSNKTIKSCGRFISFLLSSLDQKSTSESPTVVYWVGQPFVAAIESNVPEGSALSLLACPVSFLFSNTKTNTLCETPSWHPAIIVWTLRGNLLGRSRIFPAVTILTTRIFYWTGIKYSHRYKGLWASIQLWSPLVQHHSFSSYRCYC